jgi:hypothetical protein
MKDKANKIRGIYRLQIKEDVNGVPKVIGDSGWCENQITNAGKYNFFVQAVGALAGSSQISFAAVGTGTVPASTATSLNGEITDAANCRMAVTASAVSAVGITNTLQFTFSLASGIATATHAIANVGLFAVSTTAVGTILAGNTFSSSQLSTNQSLSGTYQIIF